MAAPAAEMSINPSAPNAVAFPPQRAKFVQFVVHASSAGQPCIDELEVFEPDGARNLALSKDGAKASASSCLGGHAIHRIEHLNDGLYGNSHSWIAATGGEEWAQIELPRPAQVAKVVFSRDRDGQYHDRVPVEFEVRLSLDGRRWQTVRRVKAANLAAQSKARQAPPYVPPAPLPEPVTHDGLVRYAFLCERATWQRMNADDHLSPLHMDRPALPGGGPYWGRMARLKPTDRVLAQMEEMIARLAAKGLDVAAERKDLASLRKRQATADDEALYLDARLAKRRLMFRDPDLAALQQVLFAKRHPYLSSHNYSDVLDSQFKPGGGVCVLEIPRRDGRLEPADAKLVTLFDGSGGIARDVMADFEARKVYFAYRPDKARSGEEQPYWHLMAMNADGSGLRQLTDGPFHDYYPCPLPDGGLAFISTRCKARFLCWRPQAFVLFRMDGEGSTESRPANIRPLSFANLSEWTPTVARDGRILWTRSEYIDKGADFGHTLWATRPDGTHPELIFGNNTPNCYINGREVPGTREILCTIFSHGGDHNGPLGLIDLAKANGPSDSNAVTNITPDTTPRYNMNWPRQECWRDPVPVTRDYFLASHAPADRFGLYVADRYGNRELLYLDPSIGSMCPSPLRPEPMPPALGPNVPALAGSQLGQFTVADVYQGLEPAVPRGKVKYIRVCQEVRANLEQLASGEFRRDHGPVFQDFYATPVHKVNGPNGWPTYVAKAALGIAPVEADGSASFFAPAGKVLYFEVLDENLNELQRMRSVVQLQPGEQRSCVGCHEHRQTAAPVKPTLAARRPPSKLQPPPWGTQAFAYERVVQPVWDAKCVRCHGADDTHKINLASTLDAERVPASYRTLVSGGWVHYFDMTYRLRHHKAGPLSFGTLQSKLWKLLEAGHHDAKLTRDEMHAVKCWIDLNCPLWPDYLPRDQRPQALPQVTQAH
ncbi:MAG: discoidin domain-containing protein [Verrucomicrobia bacterium]|nr:discoidin domain-containing protein [Verrucomicrobiota bacterium]